MQKKKFFLSFIILGMVAALVGCDQTEVDGVNSGNIQLSISTDSKLAGVEVKSASSAPEYSLTIQNLYGQELEYYEDCSTIGNLKIEEGSYNFIIKSGSDEDVPRVDEPYYYGKTIVDVVATQTNNVEIVGKLKNARISAEFSEVIQDEKIFSDYSFTLDDVVLTKEDIENGSSLFVSASDSKRVFNWSVELTNVQGSKNEFTGVLSGVEECSHYTYSFDVDVTMDEDQGTVGFDILVDDEVSVESDEIEINLEQRDAPSFTGSGFTVGETKVVRDIEPREDIMVLTIKAEEGLSEATLRHLNGDLFDAGVPYTISLSAISAQELAALETVGVHIDGFTVSNREMTIDFSDYVNSSTLGDYTFYLSVVDRVSQSSSTTVDFMVVPDMDHLPVSVDYGAKYAVLYGEWCSLEQPEGLSFQYRKVGDSQWTNTSEDDLVVTSAENKTFTTRIVDIEALTDYEFRTYSTAEQYDRTVSFTTEDAPEIPNLSFDDGYYDSSTWYPNASGGNSYWATGNEGVCDWPLSMSSITNHTDDAVSGKAVVMKSAEITYWLSPVSFAAGNLFIGTYETNMTDAASSATMGRAYTGKPLGLRGWYKYTPVNINSDDDGVSGSDYGKADYAHIYLTLENWGSATSRPSNPTVVAYGEFKTNQTVTSYQEFSFMLDYSSSLATTHVVIAITSSYYGVDFCGGIGSELYVDDFELIWY